MAAFILYNSSLNVNQRVPDVTQRLKLFKENVASLANTAMKDAFQKLNTSIADFRITHLITVTCTGIYAPGPGAALIEQLDLPDDIFHTAINFMSWNVTPVNFEMVLDSAIPEFIGSEVNEIVKKACEKLKTDPSAICKWGYSSRRGKNTQFNKETNASERNRYAIFL